MKLNSLQFAARQGFGIIQFLYSLVLSRGIDEIRRDMDDVNNHLIGDFGYCTQEMVNLVLVGKAISNVFDDSITLDSDAPEGGATLKGIREKSQVGYLTLLETLNYCKVGQHLKKPLFPIWVICIESHFTILFATEQLEGKKIFDLHFYDQLGNQSEEYRLTVDTEPDTQQRREESDLVPPLEECIATRWPSSQCNWNGSEPLL